MPASAVIDCARVPALPTVKKTWATFCPGRSPSETLANFDKALSGQYQEASPGAGAEHRVIELSLKHGASTQRKNSLKVMSM